MVAFPDDYKNLVPKLLIETMAAVGSSFVSRINLATGTVVPETKALAKGCILYLSEFIVKMTIILLVLNVLHYLMVIECSASGVAC